MHKNRTYNVQKEDLAYEEFKGKDEIKHYYFDGCSTDICV